jgi:hypothetical protein
MFNFIQEGFQTYFQSWIKMNPLFILMIVWFIIQFIKIIWDYIKGKKFSLRNVFAAGWFPSFHTWIATSITTMVRLTFGFDSVIFALSCWVSLLFAYDAMNVRFQSGKQAKYINEIRLDLKSALIKQKKWTPLKERIWHTPIEVLWWIIVGFVATFLLYYYFIIS